MAATQSALPEGWGPEGQDVVATDQQTAQRTIANGVRKVVWWMRSKMADKECRKRAKANGLNSAINKMADESRVNRKGNEHEQCKTPTDKYENANVETGKKIRWRYKRIVQ